MISIPIWLFVILVTLSSFLVLALVVAIIGYARACYYENRAIEEHIGKK